DWPFGYPMGLTIAGDANNFYIAQQDSFSSGSLMRIGRGGDQQQQLQTVTTVTGLGSGEGFGRDLALGAGGTLYWLGGENSAFDYSKIGLYQYANGTVSQLTQGISAFAVTYRAGAVYWTDGSYGISQLLRRSLGTMSAPKCCATTKAAHPAVAATLAVGS